ncbi:MAG TPA: hypothetical protein VMG12_19355, partial [Polyangiaceae bacterium]|nr:hypothetical protein [Polyangiaceae bacterium]
PACAPDQHRCQGANLQVCNADRTGFSLEEECNSAAQCDAEAGVCRRGGGGGNDGPGDDGPGDGPGDNGPGGPGDDDDDGGGGGGNVCIPGCLPLLERCVDGQCQLILGL